MNNLNILGRLININSNRINAKNKVIRIVQILGQIISSNKSLLLSFNLSNQAFFHIESVFYTLCQFESDDIF